MARPAHYSRLQIALHWGVALLVAALWFTQDGMGRALHQRIEGTGSGTCVVGAGSVGGGTGSVGAAGKGPGTGLGFVRRFVCCTKK